MCCGFWRSLDDFLVMFGWICSDLFVLFWWSVCVDLFDGDVLKSFCWLWQICEYLWCGWWIGYGVPTVSWIDKIVGVFCKRDLWKKPYSAEETNNLINPTDRSHTMHWLVGCFVNVLCDDGGWYCLVGVVVCHLLWWWFWLDCLICVFVWDVLWVLADKFFGKYNIKKNCWVTRVLGPTNLMKIPSVSVLSVSWSLFWFCLCV